MAEVKFPELVEAEFIKRPNRFIVICKLNEDVDLNKYNIESREVKAHLADPGRLTGFLTKGRKIWLRYVDKKSRKTKWSTVLFENDNQDGYISMKSTLPNELAEKAVKEGIISELADWDYVQSEYTVGNSRFDLLLSNKNDEKLLLEIKNVNYAEGDTAYFPDAVTKRGKKHVEELLELKKESDYETALMFIVQRDDVNKLKPNYEVDPKFSATLKKAKETGLKILAYKTSVSLENIKLDKKINLEI
ncbi:MAG: DNA/RNA nuclease SfsA [Bacillota bacterium]